MLVDFKELRVGEAHGSSKAPENLLIGESLSGWLQRRDLGRDGMVEIGHDEVVEFEKTRGRQDVICVVRRIGLEEVDRDLQQVRSLQRAAQASLVGARRGDVVVPGEERLVSVASSLSERSIWLIDRGDVLRWDAVM